MARKKGKQRKESGGGRRDRSGIKDHERRGSVLVPPLLRGPVGFTFMSWTNDRLPEMLWAVLLFCPRPHEAAIEHVRQVLHEPYENGWLDDLTGVSHSALLNAKPERRRAFLDSLCAVDEVRAALRPILLFPELPCREDWLAAIGDEPTEEDWEILRSSVGRSLWHQSQEATDARWLVVFFALISRRLNLPSEDSIREILEYPAFGDPRAVRPTIRAAELGLLMGSEEPDPRAGQWAAHFWDYCLEKTPCEPWAAEAVMEVRPGTTRARVGEVQRALSLAHASSIRTTAVDPRLDLVFGMAFYAVSLVDEALRIGADRAVGSRLILRTLVELAITLRYLVDRDDPELWRTFRVYGAGQAKLAALKFDEDTDGPEFVSIETLRAIANEDAWEEFLQIDLGHWERSNLREIATRSGTKDLYDRYYGWPSVFAHGHWGAVRDVALDTCRNPLHRLHRVLRSSPRPQPDAVPDVVLLADHVLDSVARAYPPIALRLAVSR